MKLFIYKSIIVSFLVILIFKATIGGVIKNYEKKIYESFNKEKLEYVKEKIRGELNNALEKENYFSKEDAILINKFLTKIRDELSSNNK
tara:strand:- start:791 stop:1057 length:267 start_codon:yes stop_codon:yes gene_type:complete